MNIATEVQAIIPVVFNSSLGSDGTPAELFVVDGISLLRRAMAEIAGAGISKVLIAVTHSSTFPRWVCPAIQDTQRELQAFGLPALQVEILYMGGSARLDDAVVFALSSVTAPWAAVICPMRHLPELGGLSDIVMAAQLKDQAVIGMAEANWGTAIQLCVLSMDDHDLVCGVEAYCPPSDTLSVYAGRAVLPSTPQTTAGLGTDWMSENDVLIGHCIASAGPLHCFVLQGPVSGLRFNGSPILAGSAKVLADGLTRSAPVSKLENAILRLSQPWRDLSTAYRWICDHIKNHQSMSPSHRYALIFAHPLGQRLLTPPREIFSYCCNSSTA